MLAGMHLRGCSVWPCYASFSKSLVYLSYKEAPAPLTLPQYHMQFLKSIRFLIIRTTALHTFTPTVITNYLMLYIASQSSNLQSFPIFTLFDLHNLLCPVHSTCHYSDFLQMKFLKVTCPKVKTWPKSTWLVSGRAGKNRCSGHSQCLQPLLSVTPPPSFFQLSEWSLARTWHTNVYMVIVNADKFHHHPSQGHCILMSFLQLSNMKECFPKHKTAGISEKLVGEVFMDYGNSLTPVKSHHPRMAIWWAPCAPWGSPSCEV